MSDTENNTDNEIYDDELNEPINKPIIIIVKSSYTEAQKRASDKWRTNNREKVRQYCRNQYLKRNEINKEMVREKNNIYYLNLKADDEKYQEKLKAKREKYHKAKLDKIFCDIDNLILDD
jgi:hypothetical protein